VLIQINVQALSDDGAPIYSYLHTEHVPARGDAQQAVLEGGGMIEDHLRRADAAIKAQIGAEVGGLPEAQERREANGG